MRLPYFLFIAGLVGLLASMAVYECWKCASAEQQLGCFRDEHESLLRTHGWTADPTYECHKKKMK